MMHGRVSHAEHDAALSYEYPFNLVYSKADACG